MFKLLKLCFHNCLERKVFGKRTSHPHPIYHGLEYAKAQHFTPQWQYLQKDYLCLHIWKMVLQVSASANPHLFCPLVHNILCILLVRFTSRFCWSPRARFYRSGLFFPVVLGKDQHPRGVQIWLRELHSKLVTSSLPADLISDWTCAAVVSCPHPTSLWLISPQVLNIYQVPISMKPSGFSTIHIKK